MTPDSPTSGSMSGPNHRRGMRLSLPRLVEPRRPILEGMTFEGCILEGPAVVVPLGCTFGGNDWGGPFRDVWWLLPEHKTLWGPIVADGCVFQRCRFVGVGFMSDPDTLALVGEYTGPPA
jgi:hypothetical protein